MTPINMNHEGIFYITESCYVIPQRYVLVNHDKQSERLADLPWKLLDCLMRHQDTKVKYDRIYVEVWGDPYHDSGDVATIMHRLKKYFRDIGVDDDELKEVFQTFRGDGLLFTPHKPLRPPIDELEEKLRSIGVSKSDFFEIVDCMLYRGISGRMGRERIIALAKKGNRLAAAELGELYYHYIARNHKPDYKKACEYYRLAGDRNPLSLWTLGYCTMNNFYPVVEPDKIDYLAAKNYFMRAIQIKTEEGISAAAYTSLGQLWEEGHYPADSFATTHECLPADIDQAIKYYEIADEAGYHYATNRLGRHYERISAGIEGGSPLKKKAFSYFSRSVDLIADGYALNKLGQYYETGFGCEVNPDKACECYMRGVDDFMWFKTNTPKGETTNDILQVLLNTHPGEIIAMDGPAKSGKHRMIELLVMDDETRRIDVVEDDGQDTIYSPTEDLDFGAEPDVYVLTDLDQWEDIRADQPTLLLWIESMLSNEKTIIITGEQLYERLPELIGGIQAQHGDRFSFYQFREDDLTHVNMNPYPHIHVGSLIRLGQFRRSITHPNMDPLFWRVIFRRRYMVWLLATDSVEVLNYSNEGVKVDWRHSPLRLWLNRQFLDGFSEEEIGAIMDNRSSGDEQNVDEKEAPSVPGKVILPSAYEVEHFLPDPEDRTLTTVRQRLTEKGKMEISLAPTDWWLRTYGTDAGTAAFVRADGSIDRGGKKVWEHCAVRPMVLVNLNRLPEALALAADDELPF